MKIRFDYVTNSSSTSFVIISKGKPSESVFLEALGIKKDSLLESFGKDLFDVLSSNMEDVHDAITSQYWGPARDVKSMLKKNFRYPSIAQRVQHALDTGMDIYIGTLSSDDYPEESFLCTESFEVVHPKLYINALECAW